MTGPTSRARLAAEANPHCRWRVPPGVATTRAAVLEGALPVARCSRPCCRPLEQAPATSRADRSSFATRGPFGSKAPCRWPGAAARRCDCKGEPPRSLAPAVRAASARRPQCPEAPCLAECVSQHLDGRGKPPLPLVPTVRAARPEGRSARKHSAGSRVHQSCTTSARASSRRVGAGRPSVFGPKAAVLESTLPWPGVSSGTGTARASSYGRLHQPSGLGCHKDCRARRRRAGWQSVPAARPQRSRRTPNAADASLQVGRPQGPSCPKAPCRDKAWSAATLVTGVNPRSRWCGRSRLTIASDHHSRERPAGRSTGPFRLSPELARRP